MAMSSKLTTTGVIAMIAALAKLHSFCLDCSNNLCKNNNQVLEELETNKLNFTTNENGDASLERDKETNLTLCRDLTDDGHEV